MKADGLGSADYYPGEAEIVKRIKQLYRKPRGEKRPGYMTIAKKLNEEGIPTRTGAPWSDVLVKSILTRKK